MRAEVENAWQQADHRIVQQHGCPACIALRSIVGGQVQSTILVEIRRHDSPRYGASHERELTWKRAVALAWHQRDESERSARVDRHRQVELAVIVEVAGNDRVGEQPGVVSYCLLKCSITVAQQDRDAAVALVCGYCKVDGLTLAAEAPDRNRDWGASNGVINLRAKCA